MIKVAPPNKFRAAIDVLQQGREVLIGALADEIVEQGPELIDGGFVLNELLELHGTRLHFLSLLLCQLEQSAEALDEARDATPPPAAPKKKPRAKTKKLQAKVPTEGPDDF